MAPHLPRAQSLEEEEEREAPDHGGADDAEQGDELDPLAAPELRKACSRQPRPLPTFTSYLGPSQVYRLNRRAHPSLMLAALCLTLMLSLN